ncbi:MAG: hypothetical protein QM757_23105 [Paludibaculum sp.]
MTQFPAEPALQTLSEMRRRRGHLGQVWIGTSGNRLFTLSDARVVVKNHMEFRTRDFGTLGAAMPVLGNARWTVDLEMYGQDKPVFEEIYQAALQRSPIPLMLQLGEQAAGALCGYLASFSCAGGPGVQRRRCADALAVEGLRQPRWKFLERTSILCRLRRSRWSGQKLANGWTPGVAPGVRFAVAKVSLARRAEISRRACVG